MYMTTTAPDPLVFHASIRTCNWLSHVRTCMFWLGYTFFGNSPTSFFSRQHTHLHVQAVPSLGILPTFIIYIYIPTTCTFQINHVYLPAPCTERSRGIARSRPRSHSGTVIRKFQSSCNAIGIQLAQNPVRASDDVKRRRLTVNVAAP
jgi:hypothetical protein